MRIVVVAEPKEIEIIPLAYQGLPIIVAGVGEKMIDTLERLNLENVDKIINVGYVGATKDYKIGEKVKISVGFGGIFSPKIITSDYFVDELDDDYKKTVFDMEFSRLKDFCYDNDIKLEAVKVVSDNCNYKEYKERVG